MKVSGKPKSAVAPALFEEFVRVDMYTTMIAEMVSVWKHRNGNARFAYCIDCGRAAHFGQAVR